MRPEAVLQVATEAYWHEGPGVSLNAICQRAGVAKPSLYREFGSEDGLTLAALDHYAGLVQSQVKGLLSSELSFTAKLEALIVFMSEDARYEHGCLFVKMRGAQLDLGPKTRAKVAEIEAATVEIFTRFFSEQPEEGRMDGPHHASFRGSIFARPDRPRRLPARPRGQASHGQTLSAICLVCSPPVTTTDGRGGPPDLVREPFIAGRCPAGE